MSHQSSRPLSMGMRIAMAPVGLMLRAMALLPWRVLYALASLLAFVARDMVRYRRRIVRANIRDCFPQMGADELRAVERRFYRHLADYVVETIKFAHMSPTQMRRHMEFVDTHLIDQALDSGRDIVIYTSHFGNWEWITTMGLWCHSSEYAHFSHVYRPLKQRWFDRWFLRLRSRYNVSIPMHEAFRQLLLWRRDGQRWICGFLSDQKPSHAGKVYEVDFMGRHTPFIGGTEVLARKLDAVVMYFDTEVVSRGHYRSTIRPLSYKVAELPEGELSRLYATTLEEQIRRAPAAYLWSHNRWRLPKSRR